MDGDPESASLTILKENLKIRVMRDISHQTYVNNVLVPRLNESGYSNSIVIDGAETINVRMHKGFEVWILLPPVSNSPNTKLQAYSASLFNNLGKAKANGLKLAIYSDLNRLKALPRSGDYLSILKKHQKENKWMVADILLNGEFLNNLMRSLNTEGMYSYS